MRARRPGSKRRLQLEDKQFGASQKLLQSSAERIRRFAYVFTYLIVRSDPQLVKPFLLEIKFSLQLQIQALKAQLREEDSHRWRKKWENRSSSTTWRFIVYSCRFICCPLWILHLMSSRCLSKFFIRI